METFLQILGVLCLVAIALLLLPVAWLAYKLWQIRRTFRNLMASLGEIDVAAVPPLRVHLRRVGKPDWEDRDRIELLAGPLRAAGFQDVGIFAVEPAPGLEVMALVHPQHEAYAAVYRQESLPGSPQTRVWLDIVSRYADGREVTYSTSEHVSLLDAPPYKQSQPLPGASAAELLERFLRERPPGARRPADAASFVECFESAWARECDWRAERGGLTEEEIRRLGSRDGGEASEEAISRVRMQWQVAINGHYQDQLQDAFLASGKVSAREWERYRDRIVFIHDRLSWDEVVRLASLGFGVDPDDEEDRGHPRWKEAERLAAGFAPREAFARMNELLDAPARFERIGQMTEPIAADAYLMPEMAYESEE